MLEISKVRSLLTNETNGMSNKQIGAVLNRLGDLPEDELSAAWKREVDRHYIELASFLYDRFKSASKVNSCKTDVKILE